MDTPRSRISLDGSTRSLVHAHLRTGWIGLLVFALFGMALETLHAFKSVTYLGVGNETRRLMWTLAHAHGIGLSLVHIGFAATLGLGFAAPGARLVLASRLLNWALVLIPVGFLLGGVVTYGGDPSLGVLLVPVGALLLLVALACVVWTLLRPDAASHGRTTPDRPV
jgi:hypothetical protein